MITFQAIEESVDVFIDFCYFSVYRNELLGLCTIMALELFGDKSLIISKSFFEQVQNLSFYFLMIGMEFFMNVLHRVFSKVYHSTFLWTKFVADTNEECLAFWLWHLEVAGDWLHNSCCFRARLICARLIKLLFNRSFLILIIFGRTVVIGCVVTGWNSFVFG